MEEKQVGRRIIKDVIRDLDSPTGLSGRPFKVAMLMTLIFIVISFIYFFLLERF